MSGTTFSIGIDLGGTKIEAALVDKEGQIHCEIEYPTNVAGGAKAIIKDIAQAIAQLKAKKDVPLSGIGVGVAGQIEENTGNVIFAPNLKWHQIRLQEEISHLVKLPVVVTNDVRAAMWGEWTHGAGKGFQDLICVFIGTGVGGGIVSDNKMIKGHTNCAGEIGHMTIDLSGPQCHCGNSGCLESYAGGWAIAKRAHEAIEKDARSGSNFLNLFKITKDAVTAKHVIQAYHEKDPLAKHVIEKAIEALIAGIANLANAFNPELFILGGGIAKGLPEMISHIERGVQKRALPIATEKLKIKLAQLEKNAGAIGAAVLAHRIK